MDLSTTVKMVGMGQQNCLILSEHDLEVFCEGTLLDLNQIILSCINQLLNTNTTFLSTSVQNMKITDVLEICKNKRTVFNKYKFLNTFSWCIYFGYLVYLHF